MYLLFNFLTFSKFFFVPKDFKFNNFATSFCETEYPFKNNEFMIFTLSLYVKKYSFSSESIAFKTFNSFKIFTVSAINEPFGNANSSGQYVQ